MKSVKISPLMMADKVPLQQLANNIKIAMNLRDGFPHPYTLKDAESFINKQVIANPKDIIRAIRYNNEFTGVAGLHKIKKGRAELGYWLGEPYWGKGITTGAVKALLDIAINELSLEQVYAYCFINNIGSKKVLLKSGFKEIKVVDEDCNSYQKDVKSFYFEYSCNH